MNLPKAFHTARVQQAIESLAQHVNAAYLHASDLESLGVARQKLRPESPPKPIVVSLDPLQVSQRDRTAVTFTLRGKNLASKGILAIQSLELVPRDVDPTIAGRTILFPAPTSISKSDGMNELKFKLNMESVAPGSYTLRYVDEAGQSHLPGLDVEVEEIEVPEPVKPAEPPRGESPCIEYGPEFKQLSNTDLALRIHAKGSHPLTYLWLKDGCPIANSNQDSLIVSAAEQTQQAKYAVIVANGHGIAHSDFVLVEPAKTEEACPAPKTTPTPEHQQQQIPPESKPESELKVEAIEDPASKPDARKKKYST